MFDGKIFKRYNRENKINSRDKKIQMLMNPLIRKKEKNTEKC